MEDSDSDKIRFNKYSKQHALDTFSYEYNNNFDRSIDKLIYSLIEENDQISEKYKYYEKLQKEKSEKYWELQSTLDNSDYGVDMIMINHIQDMMYLEEEILAICETKIIYGFKHFEISLKKLLHISFGKNDEIKKIKWHELINFFKQKKIIISKLEGYDEINQMRILNNVLKHSNEVIDNQISTFPEFRNNDHFNFQMLINFYNRVKNSPEVFLQSLSREIQKYLYDFSENRIENIAESYALRMNKEDAEKFIVKLKAKY